MTRCTPRRPHLAGTRSLYGPGFIALAAAGTAVTGDSALAVRLFFQGLAAAAVLIALLLVDRRTKDPTGWLLVGVNPMVVVGVVNGGHNDALVALALLGGVLLAVVRRPLLAGVAVALGVSVKIVILLPLAALLVWLWRRQGLRAALVTGGVAVGMVAGAYLLAGGRTAIEPLGRAEHQVSRSSIWNAPRRNITIDLIDDGVRGRWRVRSRPAGSRWANLAVAGSRCSSSRLDCVRRRRRCSWGRRRSPISWPAPTWCRGMRCGPFRSWRSRPARGSPASRWPSPRSCRSRTSPTRA